MNKHLTILCDMDDVLEELLPAWCAWLNWHYDLFIKPSDVLDWDMTRTYTMLSAEQVYEPLFIPEFWDSVLPKKDAVEVVHRLIYEGYPFYVVTATRYQTIEEKVKRALFTYFPFLDWSQCIIVRDKSMIKGDVIIDDAIHNLGGDRKLRLLMDAPYNRDYDEAANGVTRVYTWHDIYRAIKDYEAKEECV